MFLALGAKRKENLAKRFQRELDEKGEGDEVDIESIDWLSNTYKTKRQVALEKEKGETDAGEKVNCEAYQSIG